jgi:hypothetical protein
LAYLDVKAAGAHRIELECWVAPLECY